MNMLLAIFIGGGAGSVTRHYAIQFMTKLLGDGFPYGTLFVNVLGSFIIGLLVEALAEKFNASLELRALMVTGFLGGFTTFSAFSLDFFKLVETDQYAAAGAYALLSVAISLAAVFAGVWMVRAIV